MPYASGLVIAIDVSVGTRYSSGVKKILSTTLVLALLALCLCSCVQQQLVSESGLYDVKLVRNLKAGVDGGWTWGKGNAYAQQKTGSIYIAPLDITLVREKQPELAPLMVPQMHDYVVQYVSQALAEGNKANNMNWKLTDKESEATVRVDMALVRFRPQRPGLRLLSGVGGHFIKIPGISDVVGKFAEGDICMEMTIRDARSGQLFLACKDSNRKKVRLVSSEAFKRSGNADVNLRTWAQRLARVIRECSPDRLGNETLRQKIEERSWWDVAKDRIGW